MSNLAELDAKILNLLKQRNELSTDKTEFSLDDETALLSKAESLQLNPSYVAKLYKIINQESKRINEQKSIEENNGKWCEKYKKASYLGPVGTYSYQALKKYSERYGIQAEEIPCNNFSSLVSNVKQGISDLSFLPIENTSSGIINEVYDLIHDHGVRIIGEITLHITHAILVNNPNNCSNITTFYSHPQPIVQCSHFLKEHYPDATFVYCDSTADAIGKVKKSGAENIAAIASEFGGKLFGLTPIRTNIANQSRNFTRFIVIARDGINVPPTLKCKTSITFTTNNTPGALASVLDVFRKHNYNMTKLASRPIIGRPWEELFYADFIANMETSEAMDAIEELKKFCQLNILGCYPFEELNQNET